MAITVRILCRDIWEVDRRREGKSGCRGGEFMEEFMIKGETVAFKREEEGRNNCSCREEQVKAIELENKLQNICVFFLVRIYHFSDLGI